jgi:hypothetical protein
VPRFVAQDDEARRRANPQLLLDRQEGDAHLGPVPRPEHPGGFPKTCDRTQLLRYPFRARPASRSSPCRSSFAAID